MLIVVGVDRRLHDDVGEGEHFTKPMVELGIPCGSHVGFGLVPITREEVFMVCDQRSVGFEEAIVYIGCCDQSDNEYW